MATGLNLERCGSPRLRHRGHTPEGISILAYDLEKDPINPQAVFTGDTLFIGDVGRPDLMGLNWYDSPGAWPPTLSFASSETSGVAGRYARLPGTWRGVDVREKPQFRHRIDHWNPAAVQLCSSNRCHKKNLLIWSPPTSPETPQYFGYNAQLNRKERPTLDQAIRQELNPLSVQDILKIHDDKKQLLDVRDPADFAGGHVAGSINIGLGGKFATWAGTMLSQETPIIVIAEPGREQEAIRRLGRIGFDHVAGYLDGGMQALEAWPELIRTVTRMTAGTLSELLSTTTPPHVLDVRTKTERDNGQIETSIHIPLPHLMEQRAGVPQDEMVVVHCASGYRSSIAVSLLQQAGFTNVMDLVGGFEAWKKNQSQNTSEAIS